jgi:peptide/nickel transport system permease protein
MLRYLTQRIAMAVLTIIVISMLSFVIIQLPPGDYVTTMIAEMSASGSHIAATEAEHLRASYGLDKPIYFQYWLWISKIVKGDFGMSQVWKGPVLDVIMSRLPFTLLLNLFVVMVTWMLALPIGIYSAVKQYSFGDYAFTLFAFIGQAVPAFLIALVMMYFGFVVFDTPIGGLFSPEYMNSAWSFARFWDLLKHLVLPVMILAMASIAQTTRVMRATLLDELKKPYVETARVKGLSEFRLIMKYPVRLSLIPFISTIGTVFPYLISGTVIVALVMGLPTLGPMLLNALVAQDMFLAGAIVLILGILTVIGMLISDILLVLVDPRIKLGVSNE